MYMYRVTFKPDIINMDKLNVFQYSIQFMNYLIVSGDTYYMIKNNDIIQSIINIVSR